VSDAGELTITALAEALRTRQLSAVEAVSACLDRIARLDGTLRAFITLDAEGALAAARARDAERATGRTRGVLHGVPLAYKDLCHISGLPTSCGTATPDYFTSEDECTAMARLTDAGAISLGKLNMSELASGPFGDNPHHGDVQNPWRAGHAAGGSSSGSGAAVAAGLVFGALGTDTGGSIRLPAACCGIVGLKPTYGRVSRAGVMALSWSLDHVGPMTRSVADAALMLSVIAGHDPRDPTSSHRPVPANLTLVDGPVSGLRVGVAENYYFDGVDPEMAAAVRVAVARLEDLGARVETLTLPDPESMVSIANVVARAEAAAVHHRVLRERPHELGDAVRVRLGIGLGISATDYLQALRLRSRLTREFVAEVFSRVDVLALPVIPEPAPAYAANEEGGVEAKVARMGRFSRLTRPINGLGLPALSVPCGRSRDGRPLALQIVGRPFDEPTVLRVGHAYESDRGGLGSPVVTV
jgi:aspartyl-tRNA(Asn)/glutamyl-tRNA(Gln) amidotransferase subunit A